MKKIKALLVMFGPSLGGRSEPNLGRPERVSVVFPRSGDNVRYGAEIHIAPESDNMRNNIRMAELEFINGEAHGRIRSQECFELFDGSKVVGLGLWV